MNGVSIFVDETHNLLRVVITGKLTDEALSEASNGARATAYGARGCPVLLDLSRITKAEISSQIVVAFAQAAQKDTNRLAILAQDITAFGMARMYEMIADLTEDRVGVFTEETLALEWLAESTTAC